MNVEPLDTMKTIKTKIQDRGNFFYEQLLISGGKQLQDEKTIFYYNIKSHSLLHLTLFLHG